MNFVVSSKETLIRAMEALESLPFEPVHEVIMRHGYCCDCEHNPPDSVVQASKNHGNPCHGCWFQDDKPNWEPKDGKQYYSGNGTLMNSERSAVNPLVMRITTQSGMVNIDNDDIAYSNIRNMYTTGDGVGLQLSELLEHKRGEIIDMCAEIAGSIYELQDILSA